jgi:hypothetical protein
MGTSQSKTVFSSLVARLQGGVIEELDSAFWDEFWKTTLTAEVSAYLSVCLSVSECVCGVYVCMRVCPACFSRQ